MSPGSWTATSNARSADAVTVSLAVDGLSAQPSGSAFTETSPVPWSPLGGRRSRAADAARRSSPRLARSGFEKIGVRHVDVADALRPELRSSAP